MAGDPTFQKIAKVHRGHATVVEEIGPDTEI
jgi:hypothetical protein